KNTNWKGAYSVPAILRWPCRHTSQRGKKARALQRILAFPAAKVLKAGIYLQFGLAHEVKWEGRA
ncbi:MAG: hypothetical protein WCD54_11430, partial [Pseudolabrys sp.]